MNQLSEVSNPALSEDGGHIVGWRLPTFSDFICGEPGQATIDFYENLGVKIEYAYGRPERELIDSLQARIAELEKIVEETRLSVGTPSFAQAGEALGCNAPSWPDWCTTFATRAAYQQGVADCRVFDAKERAFDPKGQAPLTGRWHHGNGVLIGGGVRIAQWDCDSSASEALRDEVFDWICQVLNADLSRSKAARSVSSHEAASR